MALQRSQSKNSHHSLTEHQREIERERESVCGNTCGWIVPHRSLTLFLPFLANSNVSLSVSLSLDSAVTDSINQLISMCTQQAPGQKECDNALRELEVLLLSLLLLIVCMFISLCE